MPQLRVAALLLAAIAVFGAGCGGSDEAAASVASLADVEVVATPAAQTVDGATEAQDAGAADDQVTQEATDEDMALAFVACVRAAGIDEMPDPTVLSDGTVQLLPPGPQRELLADPDFEEAAEGCVELIEDATFFSAASDLSAVEDSLLEFAQCLRENGVDVDDPDLTKFVPGQGARMFGDDFDPQDPANADAIAACSSLLPNAAGN